MTKVLAMQAIRDAVHQVVGEEWAQEMVVDDDTSLSGGLELDSIEIARVIEIMLKRFPAVDFESWFAQMTMERIAGLTVGDIAGFIASSHPELAA
ncbi:hypothetical protein GJ700_08070 [Duganella sp. FT92W]|uniref:Acyl carrier protein n=1 Tax=Pseudoduganella rivuli TaxID=2666085 RepID=A0A7X2IKS6_9BURK|nr:hypothetical protein [Pseudoduganella rivuli]MRV71681.1 hypothetical protein [Pseudoduganella rivuli]